MLNKQSRLKLNQTISFSDFNVPYLYVSRLDIRLPFRQEGRSKVPEIKMILVPRSQTHKHRQSIIPRREPSVPLKIYIRLRGACDIQNRSSSSRSPDPTSRRVIRQHTDANITKIFPVLGYDRMVRVVSERSMPVPRTQELLVMTTNWK
jgi:hypothetical protein